MVVQGQVDHEEPGTSKTGNIVLETEFPNEVKNQQGGTVPNSPTVVQKTKPSPSSTTVTINESVVQGESVQSTVYAKTPIIVKKVKGPTVVQKTKPSPSSSPTVLKVKLPTLLQKNKQSSSSTTVKMKESSVQRGSVQYTVYAENPKTESSHLPHDKVPIVKTPTVLPKDKTPTRVQKTNPTTKKTNPSLTIHVPCTTVKMNDSEVKQLPGVNEGNSQIVRECTTGLKVHHPTSKISQVQKGNTPREAQKPVIVVEKKESVRKTNVVMGTTAVGDSQQMQEAKYGQGGPFETVKSKEFGKVHKSSATSRPQKLEEKTTAVNPEKTMYTEDSLTTKSGTDHPPGQHSTQPTSKTITESLVNSQKPVQKTSMVQTDYLQTTFDEKDVQTQKDSSTETEQVQERNVTPTQKKVHLKKHSVLVRPKDSSNCPSLSNDAKKPKVQNKMKNLLSQYLSTSNLSDEIEEEMVQFLRAKQRGHANSYDTSNEYTDMLKGMPSDTIDDREDSGNLSESNDGNVEMFDRSCEDLFSEDEYTNKSEKMLLLRNSSYLSSGNEDTKKPEKKSSPTKGKVSGMIGSKMTKKVKSEQSERQAGLRIQPSRDAKRKRSVNSYIVLSSDTSELSSSEQSCKKTKYNTTSHTTPKTVKRKCADDDFNPISPYKKSRRTYTKKKHTVKCPVNSKETSKGPPCRGKKKGIKTPDTETPSTSRYLTSRTQRSQNKNKRSSGKNVHSESSSSNSADEEEKPSTSDRPQVQCNRRECGQYRNREMRSTDDFSFERHFPHEEFAFRHTYTRPPLHPTQEGYCGWKCCLYFGLLGLTVLAGLGLGLGMAAYFPTWYPTLLGYVPEGVKSVNWPNF